MMICDDETLEMVLKLATRVKLHMGHLIYDNWYFSWIPLLKRCRIDLKIIWLWDVQMKLWIYFDYGQIIKVDLFYMSTHLIQ